MVKTKQWKVGGKEDEFVEKMINEGSVANSTTAASLKMRNPIVFGSFSDNVVRNHLTDLKRKNGLYLCENEEDVGDNNDEKRQKNDNADGVKVKIEEKDATDSPPGPVIQLDHQNFPFICEVYKDPSSRMDVVLVMVNLPGGAENVQIELNNDGTIVIIKYNWAKGWYNVKNLFSKFVAAKELTMHHPKVLAVENALEKCRLRIDSAPESTMTIKLPIRVQTAPETWKKNGIARDDGMQIVMVEFIGYVKEYHKMKLHSAIVFDK